MKNAMKPLNLAAVLILSILFSCQTLSNSGKETNNAAIAPDMEKVEGNTRLYLDVHNMGPGNVTYEAVEEAHQKDLQVQDKFGVSFIKYWVDEKAGKVYCLAEASAPDSIKEAHRKAHGLVPDFVYAVTDGMESLADLGKKFFFDVHNLGAGKVTAKAVAEAHEKDLAFQSKYGVNFINYWVDEKKGVVMCLSQASSADSVVATHKQAHGLLPDEIEEVKQGN